MDTLLRQIKAQFAEEIGDDPSRRDVEHFVGRAFASRNIVPTPALVRNVVEHLLYDRPIGHLAGLSLNHFRDMDEDLGA